MVDGGKMKIKTEITIAAAHFVWPTDTKCQRLHGHNWRVIVEVEGEPENGMLIDFIHIKEAINEMDHKVVVPTQSNFILLDKHDNNLIVRLFKASQVMKEYSIPVDDVYRFPFSMMTCETMAKCIYNMLKGIDPELEFTITVYETENSYARYP